MRFRLPSRLMWGSVLVAVALAPAAFADAPAASSAPADSAAPVTPPSASVSAAPARPATGYGYSTRPAAAAGARPVQRTAAARPAAPSGPVATLPGFEMQSDGSSRLFVQLTQTVQVEERVAKGQLTYVLKGTHVTVHNNQNPLETVHFNTPVTRARLVPSGGDLLFVIELRAAATPTWKITPAKDGSAILMVDFPKGSYLGAPPPPAPPPSGSAAPRR